MYLYRPIGRAVPSIVLAIVLAGLSTTPVIAQTVNASDADGDGIADTVDNCPNTANRAQRDTDDDGMGNACDNDIDNDDIANDQDNCPTRANPKLYPPTDAHLPSTAMPCRKLFQAKQALLVSRT